MADYIPLLTISALDNACNAMDSMNGAWAAGKTILMCIFEGRGFQAFQDVQDGGRRAEAPRVQGSLNVGQVEGSADALTLAHMDETTAHHLGMQEMGVCDRPTLGVGRVNLETERGMIRQACALSSVAQLVEAHCGVTVGSVGTIGQQVRRLNGIRQDGIVPIADVWWAVMARTRGCQPQPRLLVLRTESGRIRDDTVEVVAGPGAWNGSLVAAAGGGAHFRPVWWSSAGQRGAAVPDDVSRVYGPRASPVIDAGAAAAIMMLAQAQLYCKAAMNPRSWPEDEASDVDIERWRIEINHVLDRRGISTADTGRWDIGYVMVVCGYPDPDNMSAADNCTAPSGQMIKSSRVIGHIDRLAQHFWMVTADVNGAILGRVRKGVAAVRDLNLLGADMTAAASCRDS